MPLLLLLLLLIGSATAAAHAGASSEEGDDLLMAAALGLGGGDGESKGLAVDVDKLDLIFYRAAIVALLKGKAHSLLSTLPPIETTLFNQCSSQTSIASGLAKCVTHLMDLRDQKEDLMHTTTHQEQEDGWLGWLVRKAWDVKFLHRLGEEIKKAMQRPMVMTSESEEEEDESVEEEETISSSSKNIKKNFLLYNKYTTFSRRHHRHHHHLHHLKILKRIRAKRRISPSLSQSSLIIYSDKLSRLHSLYSKAQHCSSYVQRVSQRNAQFLQHELIEGNAPSYRLRMVGTREERLLRKASLRINNFIQDHTIKGGEDNNMRFLSPELLSIFPSPIENSSGSFLSPTIFSLHPSSDGLIPLHLLAKQHPHWLDILLSLTGVGRVLDRVLLSFEAIAPKLEGQLYPAIIKMEQFEERYRRVVIDNRKQQLDRWGYSILTKEQSRELFGNATNGSEEEEDVEVMIENDIRTIAQMDQQEQIGVERRRPRRSPPMTSTGKLGQLRTLSPFLFTHQVSDGAAFRHISLSPRAFGMSLLSPEFMSAHVLSPGAFVPVILSPRAMVANILSPNAFMLNILSPTALEGHVLSPRALYLNALSPRTMTAFVLSPKALMIEVLAPRAFDLNVLSGTSLGLVVLTPTVLSTAVGSPHSYEVTVLSPNILSPTFFSQGSMNVQILSPTILGGNLL